VNLTRQRDAAAKIITEWTERDLALLGIRERELRFYPSQSED
jgi:hypothetical protein